MTTIVANKKDFLAYLDSQISDTEILVLTTAFSGTVEGATKKRNSKKVGGFEFNAAAFSQTDSIGHIYKGKSPFAVIVCEAKDISETGLEIAKTGKNGQ